MTVAGRFYSPFRPLPMDLKIAVAAIFMWMLLLSVGVTAALVKLGDQADQHFKEQRATAHQAYEQCQRAKVFGPPFIDHIERVEERLHLHALEGSVEWPLGSGKYVSVLDFYRSTIPRSCPPH